MNSRDLLHRLPPDARILLIRLRSMGDCLLLTSPVRALKSEFPGFAVSVLVEERFASCFQGNPDFPETIVVRGKGSTIASLMTRRFDLIVNLHGGPTSLVYALSARGTRVGAEHYQHAWLYSGRFPKPDPQLHTAASTLSTFQWLGVRSQLAPPLRFERNPDAARHVASLLQGRFAAATHEQASPESRYVVVHPAALMETKRWPSDRFAALVGWLLERRLKVVLTCGPGEEALLSTLPTGDANVTALSGLTIPELAELIRGARMYIGNDSGPMHLATAVGTPTVAIWGSSSSVRWHPWAVEHLVVQNPFACNPCPGYRCLVASSPLCIESVTVDQVQRAVQELLAG